MDTVKSIKALVGVVGILYVGSLGLKAHLISDVHERSVRPFIEATLPIIEPVCPRNRPCAPDYFGYLERLHDMSRTFASENGCSFAGHWYMTFGAGDPTQMEVGYEGSFVCRTPFI